MAHLSWLPEESTLIACSNLLLIVLLVVVSAGQNRWRRLARRGARKLMVTQKRAKGLQYALNVTVNQYHSLRRKLGKGPRGMALTPPLVHLDAPVPKMIVPPPLDLAPAIGEESRSWRDSGIHTVIHPSSALPVDDSRTRPIPPISAQLLQSRTRPPH